MSRQKIHRTYDYVVQKVRACAECGRRMDAQRSTKVYCSEACKQHAKRKRQREQEAVQEARDEGRFVAANITCQVCGRLLPRTLIEVSTKGESRRYGRFRRYGPHRYCGDECRREARRVRERKARATRRGFDAGAEEAERERAYRVGRSDAYRVMDDPDFPLPCGYTRDWHETVVRFIAVLQAGGEEAARVLAELQQLRPAKPDPPREETPLQMDGPSNEQQAAYEDLMRLPGEDA
jgi:hypothetical protein